MLRRNEKSTSPSRRPLSPPNPHPRNPLFKSKPENNYPLNNNGIGKESSNSGVASRISQSTSGLNCLMVNSGLDNNGSGKQMLSGWRSDPRLSESNGSNFAIRHVSVETDLFPAEINTPRGNHPFMSSMFELSEGASARAPAGEETSPGRADQRPDDVDAEQEQVQSCVSGVPEARAEHSGGVRRREHGLQADHQRRGRGGKATSLIAFEGWGGRSRRNEQERKPRRNKIIQR